MDAEEAAAAATAAVPSPKQVAGGVNEREKHAADAAPAAAPAVEAANNDTSGKEEEVGVRLSQSLVNCILGMKPEVVEDADEYYARMTSDPANKQLFGQEYIDEGTEVLRHLAESSARVFARFEKFQAWARAEYEEKGFVEVDDDYIAQRVLLRQAEEAEEEEWPEAFGPMEGLMVADT